MPGRPPRSDSEATAGGRDGSWGISTSSEHEVPLDHASPAEQDSGAGSKVKKAKKAKKRKAKKGGLDLNEIAEIAKARRKRIRKAQGEPESESDEEDD